MFKVRFRVRVNLTLTMTMERVERDDFGKLHK